MYTENKLHELSPRSVLKKSEKRLIKSEINANNGNEGSIAKANSKKSKT